MEQKDFKVTVTTSLNVTEKHEISKMGVKINHLLRIGIAAYRFERQHKVTPLERVAQLADTIQSQSETIHRIEEENTKLRAHNYELKRQLFPNKSGDDLKQNINTQSKE